jgi:hypothetical protein
MNDRYAICTRCGAAIKEVYLIGGKPYGSTCAERELGIKFEPSFTGGNVEDYLERKAKKEEAIKKWQDEFQENHRIAVQRTKDNFDLLRKISIMYYYARDILDNEWLSGFVWSVKEQMNIAGLFPSPIAHIDNYEELYKEWDENPALGDPHYIQCDIKTLEDLSPKQLAVLERNGLLEL